MPVRHNVHIQDTDEHYACAENRSLLQGMENLNRRGIPIGCRNGGCGVCKVQIVEGAFTAKVMSRAHVSAEEQASGCVLACRVQPLSDIRLAVVGKMRKSVCRPVDGAPGPAQSAVPARPVPF
jgi:ferredoxin